MPKDPVCGMEVDKETAIKRKIGDRTSYFCNQSCKTMFDKNLAKYAGGKSGHSVNSCCCC